MTVLIDTQDATAEAAAFLYAVIAALGMDSVELPDADDSPKAANIQVSGNTLYAAQQQWQYPDHESLFEHWLVTTCFPAVETSTVWAVVQTGAQAFPLLAAALAYAHADHGSLLIDADATGALTNTILTDTDQAVEVLDYDHQLPSPHIYLLNAPRWQRVTLMLQRNRSNPLHSVLLLDVLSAARYHFKHTVIDCGGDLFLAQRLAAADVRVIHLDDASRPLYVDLKPYKSIEYFTHRIPEYATRTDFEFIAHNTRRRATLRRWAQQGDQS